MKIIRSALPFAGKSYRRRAALEAWFDAGAGRVRCLAWEADTGLKWAELLANLRRAGRAMPIKDSLIASTALLYGLTAVTRNSADFAHAGVKLVNPFTQ